MCIFQQNFVESSLKIKSEIRYASKVHFYCNKVCNYLTFSLEKLNLMWLKEKKHTKYIVKYFFTARSNFMKKR